MTSYVCKGCGGRVIILPSRPVPADRLCHLCEAVKAERIATGQAEIERLTKELNSCKDRSMKQFGELAIARERLNRMEQHYNRICMWFIGRGKFEAQKDPIGAAIKLMDRAEDLADA